MTGRKGATAPSQIILTRQATAAASNMRTVEIKRTFQEAVRPRPEPQGLDLLVSLKHFAIITYAVEPERLGGMIPKRFHLHTVEIEGRERALVSAVPFLDGNFTSAVRPLPGIKTGQTDYRTYIVDTETGEPCIWLFGSVLGSWLRVIPRSLWRLPCYGGRLHFECGYDEETQSYHGYKMHCRSRWAEAEVDIVQPAGEPIQLPGFPDTETGLVVLTHPLTGFYGDKAGGIGSFCVWHEPLQVAQAQLRCGKFAFFSRIGLVTQAEQATPHSVLLAPAAEFTVYLPPKRCSG